MAKLDRVMMIVRSMTNKEREELFDELAGEFCTECGEKLPPENSKKEHECAYAEEDGEEAPFSTATVVAVGEAADIIENEELRPSKTKNVFALVKFIEAEDAEVASEFVGAVVDLVLATDEDPAEDGDDGDPEADEENDNDDE